jgi:hypothetical protein
MVDRALRGKMRRPSKNVLRLSLEKRAEMAFKEAVEEVIVEHARLNLPLHVWRDGKVVELSPDEVLRESKV